MQISDCSHIEPFDEDEPLKISTYYDVRIMMIAHIVSLVLEFLKSKWYYSKDDLEKDGGACNTYKRSVIMLIHIVNYIVPILILQYELFNPNIRDAGK